jgi:hypothetical protein
MSILAGLILGLSMDNNQAQRVMDLSKYTEKYENFTARIKQRKIFLDYINLYLSVRLI